MDRKTILVTGGAGFIGSHLVEKYVKEGYLTKVLDNFSSGKVNNIRGLFNHSKNFKLIRGDVRDGRLVREATIGVDIIFHLAAEIHVDRSIIDPRETIEVNTLGTLNILEAALENDVELVVLASSSEVYGSTLYAPMDEQHPLNPGSPYAASKVAADRLCYSYYNTYKLPVVIVRCFNTYGPRQSDSGYAAAIPKMISRVLNGIPPIIYGDGTQTRDYLWVNDAVKAYNLVMNSYENLLGKEINFGTGREITILDLANKIIEYCGQNGNLEPIHVDPRPGEVKRLCADTNLAKKELGFVADYNIEKGLQEFIEWYKMGKNEELRAYSRD